MRITEYSVQFIGPTFSRLVPWNAPSAFWFELRGEDDVKGGEEPDPVTQQSDRSTGGEGLRSGQARLHKLVKGSRTIDVVRYPVFSSFGSVASILLPRAQAIRRVRETSVSAPACRVRVRAVLLLD